MAKHAISSLVLGQVALMRSGGGVQNGSIVINERLTSPVAGNSAERRSVQADADYARQLQAKMDAQETRNVHR